MPARIPGLTPALNVNTGGQHLNRGPKNSVAVGPARVIGGPPPPRPRPQQARPQPQQPQIAPQRPPQVTNTAQPTPQRPRLELPPPTPYQPRPYMPPPTEPQQAAADPAISKGAPMMHMPSLFDFGGPASANPDLGRISPAMSGLLDFFKRRPVVY